MRYKNGYDFFNKLYKDLYIEYDEYKENPLDYIEQQLNRLDIITKKANANNKMDILKSFYYKKYIVKELPENYIESINRRNIELGYGRQYIDYEKELEIVRNNQKQSLDKWIDYLSSDDSIYPIWFKTYVFQGIIKIGSYDNKNNSFNKRTNTTTSPFIELNKEALSSVYDVIAKLVNSENLSLENEKALENGDSFKKLYLYYLNKLNEKENIISNEGIWIKYFQKSDYKILCNSLQGKNTGWCTVGYEVCKKQIDNGDFYVYYTKDSNGEYTNPRIAIRMEDDDTILEIRGIGYEQNLEPCMLNILEEKLNDFVDKENYYNKINNMKLLTSIYNKQMNNEILNSSELAFIYEVEGEIEGFGWDKDPRIDEILEKRNIVDDYNLIFKEQNNLNGSYFLDEVDDLSNVDFPESLNGTLSLDYAKSIKGIKLPNYINGSLFIDDVDITNYKFPETINEMLYIRRVTDTTGTIFPKNLGGLLAIDKCEGVLNIPISYKGKVSIVNNNCKVNYVEDDKYFDIERKR